MCPSRNRPSRSYAQSSWEKSSQLPSLEASPLRWITGQHVDSSWEIRSQLPSLWTDVLRMFAHNPVGKMKPLPSLPNLVFINDINVLLVVGSCGGETPPFQGGRDAGACRLASLHPEAGAARATASANRHSSHGAPNMARSPVVRRIAFTDVPILGTALMLEGQRFVVAGVHPHRRNDGTDIVLITWRGHCAHCGREFIQDSGLISKGINRRCHDHRQPGHAVSVDGFMRKQRFLHRMRRGGAS